MGRYLTTLRNRKFELVRSGTCPNCTYSGGNNGVQPDENYAREVMQLFSIGLLVRGDDFYTVYPDAGNDNLPRQTYTEADISELARVFTGLSYQCTQGDSLVGGVTLSRNCGPSNAACTGSAFSAAGRRSPKRSVQSRPVRVRSLTSPFSMRAWMR